MRTLFAAVLLAAPAAADDPKPKADPPAKKAAPKKAEPTLKVGDPAPPLTVSKMLQGEPVPAFEAGKVYVVEFWATWCGPCIVMMPHLADLADEYQPKGVTVVGFSSMANDKKDLAEKFVAKRGPKLGYRFAWADTAATETAWMRAAGQNGIPCSFVVDKDGKLAYIGHPMYLDAVLPQVVAGTWDPAKAESTLAGLTTAFRAAGAAAASSDPAEGLTKLTALLAERPEVGGIPYLFAPRLNLLVRAGKFDEAAALATAAVGKAVKRDDAIVLAAVAATLRTAKGQTRLVKLAVDAADANLQVSGDDSVSALMVAQATYAAAGQADKAKGFAAKAVAAGEKAAEAAADADKWRAFLQLAGAHKAAGDADKAKAAAEKAVTAAGDQRGLKEYVAQQAKQFGVEPKKDDDK